MIQTKICGLGDDESLAAAVSGGAAWVGFVFFPPSPRNLGLEAAAALGRRVPGHVGRVGVFVDAEDSLVDAAVAAAGLSVIQLHGSETPARAAALQARTGLEVWKAVPVRTAADLDAARAWRGAVAKLVLDAKPPAGAALPGGNGLRFDWRLLSGVTLPLPWLLSGGLDAQNVAEAVRVTRAAFIDVSSSVEDAPGKKSPDKIRQFLKAAATA